MLKQTIYGFNFMAITDIIGYRYFNYYQNANDVTPNYFGENAATVEG
jgi:hypothetical protein